MVPQRSFVQSMAEWEEILPFLEVVENRVGIVDETPEQLLPGRPLKGCLKPFRMTDIRYNVVSYIQDPDLADKYWFRFPKLNTSLRRGTSRTASPPPRPDDPNGIWSEFGRRCRGERFMGPPLPKSGAPRSKSFVRAADWECDYARGDLSNSSIGQ